LTVSGFTLLMLAFLGSKLVLELILGADRAAGSPDFLQDSPSLNP
jgi:hypothetical protein